ncbi:hypothetical protein [Actinoallomurus rhizosphaericola]|uniref:hypothetical protein n=1 Tax=Actinoallomurus rhizosphaericola TaxID=2952536 RepID=UPI002092274F|nr:hypothetical protein [Actinoallomurus rhizosphaericola]MCO5998442.1 hypothetical protein [Actinoallomurus rhizosphaericola]
MLIEQLAAAVVARLPEEVMYLDTQIAELDVLTKWRAKVMKVCPALAPCSASTSST